jgi:hypothetical protein
VRLLLQVINMSPFSVELDRANMRFVYGTVITNLSHIDRKTIAPGEITSISLRAGIPDGHAKQIAERRRMSDAWLEGNINFNRRVRQFPKYLANLSNVQVTVINENLRTKRNPEAPCQNSLTFRS